MGKARLGSVVSSFSGSVGGLVVLEGRGGVAVRAKPTYRRATSPAQTAVEARMRAASALWSSMDAAQVARWRAWGEARGRTAQTAFVALATKLLMVDPTSPVPLAPPARDFVADDVAVTASEPPSFACERGGQGGESGGPGLSTPHPPPLTGVKGGGAGILFSATGPNRPGTLTHLLLLAPGSYAVGYRFVDRATGQQGPAILLGVVRVG